MSYQPFLCHPLIERDTNPDVTVAQSNGSVDTTFGSNGTVTLPFGGGSGFDFGTTMVSDQGQVMTVSIADGSGSTPTTVTVTRYTSSGSVDTTFGIDGSVVTSVPGWESFVDYGLPAVQINGQFLLAIETTAGSDHIARFNADGTLDTTFGDEGLATLDPTGSTAGPTAVEEVAVEPNGTILIAGASASGTATSRSHPPLSRGKCRPQACQLDHVIIGCEG